MTTYLAASPASAGSSVHSPTDSATQSEGGSVAAMANSSNGSSHSGGGGSGSGSGGVAPPAGLELLESRRAVSLLGQPGGFDAFASSLLQRESSGMVAAALHDLDPAAARRGAYKFDAAANGGRPSMGAAAAGGGDDATAGLGFDYTAGRSPGEDDEDGQDTTPQQAQAELGAMLHNIQRLNNQQQWQQQQQQQHRNTQPPALVSMQRGVSFGLSMLTGGDKMDLEGGGGGGATPGGLLPLARGESGLPTSPEGFTSANMEESPTSGNSSDDPLAFPSMNRGASNIQAALEELQQQEQVAHGSYVGSNRNVPGHPSQSHPSRLAPIVPRELSHSQQSWSEANDADYHSEYNSQNHSQVDHADDESDMHGGGGGGGAGAHGGRLEYDGSKYAYAVHISGVEAGAHAAQAGTGLQQQQQQQQPHAWGLHGHYNYNHGHGHGHGHHHSHSHTHSHSIPPTVPPVIEEVVRDASGRTMSMDSAPPLPMMPAPTLHQPMPHSALGLDPAYLPHMQAQQQQQHAQHASLQHPYGRTGPSGPSSVTTLRRSTSPLVHPHPSLRHAHSPTPSVVSHSNSPAGVVPRRHLAAGAAQQQQQHLQGSALQSHPHPHPHPHSHSPGAPSLPAAVPILRMIGRSPSADSLHSPASSSHTLPPPQMSHTMGPRHHSYTAGAAIGSPSPPGGGGDSGRELHLHPSAAQAQAQSARPHHSPPHLQAQQQQLLQQQQLQLQQLQRQQAELQQSVQRSQQQLAAAAAAAAASSAGVPLDPLPSFSPSYGRSFSTDNADNMYYSDSGVVGLRGSRGAGSQDLSGAATPNSARYHSAHCPTCAGGGSCDDMHLLLAAGGGGANGNYRMAGYASASAASSGTTTPLRGPRGSSSGGINDLHRLLLLHGQGGGAGAGGGAGGGVGSTTLLPHCPPGAAGPGGSGGSGVASASDRIGAYTREERAKRLARYKEKKQRRFWGKRVLYACRQTFAVSRKRVGGRFIKKENASCACPDLCLPGCVNYKGGSASAAGESAASSSPPIKTESHKKK